VAATEIAAPEAAPEVAPEPEAEPEPGHPAIVAGRDGMLFARADFAVEQICGAAGLDEVSTRKIATAYEARFAWCALRDMRHFVFVVPDKIAAYADQLPTGLTASADRAALRIRSWLAPRFLPFFLYPLDRLVEGRATRETYFRTDSGWSPYGAYLGYRELAEAMEPYLPLEPIAERALEIMPHRLTGDLGVLLDPPPVESFDGVLTRRILPVRSLLLNQASPLQVQVRIYENDDRNLPSLVIFHSPAADQLIGTFLAAHFSRIVAVGASGGFFPDLILSEMPDVVVTELPEYSLAPPAPGGVALPEDLARPDFTVSTGLKLPLVRRA